jgi:hypothetical protein
MVTALEIDANKRAHSRATAVAKSHARSRVSNHRDILPDVDGRSIVARRYRDISAQILADQGGLEQCSESRLQLIRRFAAAAVLAEQMEARLAKGEQIDISEHSLLCSTLTRLATRLGIDRVPKPVMSSGDLLAQDLEEQQQEALRQRELQQEAAP